MSHSVSVYTISRASQQEILHNKKPGSPRVQSKKMANHHRNLLLPQSRKSQLQEEEDDEQPLLSFPWLRRRPKSGLLLRFLFPISLLLSFFLLPLFFFFFFFPSPYPSSSSSSSTSSSTSSSSSSTSSSSSLSSPLWCDRSSFRTDVCFVNGDIRAVSSSSSLLIFSNSSSPAKEEVIKPYTRKWESSTMSTIDEVRLTLRHSNLSGTSPKCDAVHNVPAVVFSTGGYTGNVYHEFNDGLIPLYLTSRLFNRRVVFLILEYHSWWISKYGDLISVLSDFPSIDFGSDSRTHCFPQAIVGLQIYGELAVGESMPDFRKTLDEAYRPRIRSILPEVVKSGDSEPKPKLVVICRNGSRAIENEAELVAMAEEVGFRVELLRPERTTEMAKIYMAMNSTDAMIGVHGAAMTHFLFMKPGSVFIQIVPLGLEWPAEEYYGRPAAMAGLRYESYGILESESSLSRKYGKDDPVLKDPERVNAMGWETTKRVYLEGQSVRLDLARFRKSLLRAYIYLKSEKKKITDVN